jgi:hypothetical protein
LAGEDVGEEGLCFAAVGDYLAILVNSVIVELLFVEQLAVSLVPAGRHVGRIACGVAVEILAEEGGLVTGLLQTHSDSVLLVLFGEELLEAPVRRIVSLYGIVMGVEAGEDGRPRRAPCRETHEGVFEGGTSFDQPGTYLGHLLGRGEVQVVGEDEDYVRSIGRRLRLFFLRSPELRTTRAEEEKDSQKN